MLMDGTSLQITCLLVPQSMSYASGLAHLNPVNGMYRQPAACRTTHETDGTFDTFATGLFSVIIPAFIYFIFGTCRQLSVGPEAALSLLFLPVVYSLDYQRHLLNYAYNHTGLGKLQTSFLSLMITTRWSVSQICELVLQAWSCELLRPEPQGKFYLTCFLPFSGSKSASSPSFLVYSAWASLMLY